MRARWIFLSVLAFLGASAALAQLPPFGLGIGITPIQNGTPGDCLTVGSNDQLSQSDCSGGAQTFSAGTTGFTPNSATSGAVTLAGTLIGANGGTGVGNSGKTITLGGNLTTSGAFATTLTATAATGVTLPTTGTLQTLAGAETLSGKTFTSPIVTSTAWGSIGSAATAGQIVRVTDVGNNSVWVANGTRWKPMNGCTLLATADANSGNVSNAAETIVLQFAGPAAFFQLKDRIRFVGSFTKSGTTNSAIVRLHMGTAGTIADTQVANWSSLLGAANRTAAMFADLRIETATSVQRLLSSGATSTAGGYSNLNNSAPAAAVTISNVSNALFLSVGILSGGATDTVTMLDGQLFYCATAN